MSATSERVLAETWGDDGEDAVDTAVRLAREVEAAESKLEEVRSILMQRYSAGVVVELRIVSHILTILDAKVKP